MGLRFYILSGKNVDDFRTNNTHVSNTTELGFDSLNTFFHNVIELEPGVIPSKSILRSPFASSGMGCAALDVGIERGAESCVKGA